MLFLAAWYQITAPILRCWRRSAQIKQSKKRNSISIHSVIHLTSFKFVIASVAPTAPCYYQLKVDNVDQSSGDEDSRLAPARSVGEGSHSLQWTNCPWESPHSAIVRSGLRCLPAAFSKRIEKSVVGAKSRKSENFIFWASFSKHRYGDIGSTIKSSGGLENRPAGYSRRITRFISSGGGVFPDEGFLFAAGGCLLHPVYRSGWISR